MNRSLVLLVASASLAFGCSPPTNPVGPSANPTAVPTSTPTVPVTLTISSVIGVGMNIKIDNISVASVAGPVPTTTTCGATFTQTYSVPSGPHQVNLWQVYSGLNWDFSGTGGLVDQTVTVNMPASGNHGVNVTCNGTTGSTSHALATVY